MGAGTGRSDLAVQGPVSTVSTVGARGARRARHLTVTESRGNIPVRRGERPWENHRPNAPR